MSSIIRCPWPRSEISIAYHDHEWGVPVHDDRLWFEFLTLDAAQAGLSWEIVLRKREGFRRAFANFEPRKVARFNAAKVEKLLTNPAIIRNRLKIESTISNAKQFLKVQEDFGSFDNYIWRFVNGKPIHNAWRSFKDVPPRTKESDAVSKDLSQRGFRFVGSTICYAMMQAAGMANDHLVECFRHAELRAESKLARSRRGA